MAHRYTRGSLAAHANPEYAGAVHRAVQSYIDYMDTFAIGGEAQKDKKAEKQIETDTIEVTIGALGNIQSLANSGNRILEKAAPWKLAKQSPQHPDLPKVMFTVAELLRIVAILISPVLPKSAHRIFDQLNWKMELSGKEERFSLADAEWGRLPDGHVVGKPVPLFPRIEILEGV